MGRPVEREILENAPPGGMPPIMDGLPVLSGRVSLVTEKAGNCCARTPIVLKVYRSAFGGSYAVLSPDKAASIKDSGAFNLRKCRVSALPASQSPSSKEHHFQIIADDHREGAALTFGVPSEHELRRWVKELTLMTSSSSGDRNRLPLRTLGQIRPMSPMPGHVKRRAATPATSLPSLLEEE